MPSRKMSSTSTVCAAVPLISAAARIVALRPSASFASPRSSSSLKAFSRETAGAMTAPGNSAACQSITARLAWRRMFASISFVLKSCAKAAKRSTTCISRPSRRQLSPQPVLGLIRGVDAVGEPAHRWPLEQAHYAAHAALIHVAGFLHHRGARQQHLVLAGLGEELRQAGALEAVHRVERLRDAAPDRQRAVIAKQHDVALAEVLDQALSLIHLDRHPFVI